MSATHIHANECHTHTNQYTCEWVPHICLRMSATHIPISHVFQHCHAATSKSRHAAMSQLPCNQWVTWYTINESRRIPWISHGTLATTTYKRGIHPSKNQTESKVCNRCFVPQVLCAGCLVSTLHFPQKSPIISGSFAKIDPQLKILLCETRALCKRVPSATNECPLQQRGCVTSGFGSLVLQEASWNKIFLAASWNKMFLAATWILHQHLSEAFYTPQIKTPQMKTPQIKRQTMQADFRMRVWMWACVCLNDACDVYVWMMRVTILRRFFACQYTDTQTHTLTDS